jgi:hypothetical protein
MECWEARRIMSGPIVRKYGFPNFEKIFGERPLEHGVDESGETEQETKKKTTPAKEKPKATKKTAGEPKATKSKK